MTMAIANQVRILSFDETCPKMPIIAQGGTASAVVWPGTGAQFRTMHHIDLDAGGSTIRLQHEGEAVYYVKQGTGSVSDPDAGTSDALIEGSMVFIEPGTAYRFAAADTGMILLGGPCPADPSLYAPV